MMKKIIIGITGASGSIYGKRMVEVLLENQIFVILIATEMARRCFFMSLIWILIFGQMV
ncbi:MAG TPA: flavoprotein [Anaerovoracaceae bacterium]|nr:flavoprotein [Anaerovoracaceae bacterium]